MMRKIALQLGGAILLALIVWNGYIAVAHPRQMQTIAALTRQSSVRQAKISGVQNDLAEMETGQRGYLLTGDASYLRPYTAAKDKIAADFAGLRAGLADRAASERSQETQLESLAKSMQDEMERTITLRQQGYRHRAFKVVDSNQGMQDMDRAREILSSLSAAEAGSFASIEQERSATQSKALKEAVGANLGLLAVAVGLCVLVLYDRRVLQQESAHSAQRLASHEFRLAQLTSALSTQARTSTSAIAANVRLLLQEYGGFLPRHAHECAEQIEQNSVELEQLRQRLVGEWESGDGEEEAVHEAVA